MVAAALVGSAVVGGVTSVVSGNKSAGAIKDAASTSDATQRYIYDTTRADYAPWRSTGQQALGKLAQMYGLTPYAAPTPTPTPSPTSAAGLYSGYGLSGGPFNFSGIDWTALGVPSQPGTGTGTGQSTSTPAPTPAPAYGGYQMSPSYQFRRDEAMKAIERSAASRGALRGGATMKSMARYADNLASSDFEAQANRLAALAGVGQTATESVANAGQNYANQTSANAMAAGQARASAYANTGNAINGTVGNLASAYLYGKGWGG